LSRPVFSMPEPAVRRRAAAMKAQTFIGNQACLRSKVAMGAQVYIEWRARRDSNSRPSESKSITLRAFSNT
jgi:hypothetical protein